RPLALALSVLRDGQRARTVEASLLHEGTTLARCTALFLRADPGSVPPSEAPAAPAAGPEAGRPIPEHVRAWSPFFTGVDTRVIEGELQQPGPAAVWLSLRRPLVAGEENSPLVQAVSAADLASGISAVVDLRAWSFINADLTMTLWRRPEGSWILVRAETNPGDLGRGSALGALSDLWGPFGSCALNLIFERAARG
ncbi:MAG: thioesterase family protein, partial [Candidatus Rokubacteria bacterium]|nr:thioesterase family protein [Candidatus Rokubacteria bacterium]